MDVKIRVYRQLRRVCLVAVAATSMLVAIVLAWRLLPQEVIGRVSTAQLLAIIALFIFPPVTVIAWRMDRRARAAAAAETQSTPANPHEPARRPGTFAGEGAAELS